MRILELGKYVAPAYAGMLLAEQGHNVIKWKMNNDPLDELAPHIIDWANYGKTIHPIGDRRAEDAHGFDVIITNLVTLDPWAVYRATLIPVVKIEPLNTAKSFDVIAQAQAGIKHRIEFYIGDTAAGLFMAFKALNMDDQEVAIIQHPAAILKLMEGELIKPHVPEDDDTYQYCDDGAKVIFNGETYTEKVRDYEWQIVNIDHQYGRILF